MRDLCTRHSGIGFTLISPVWCRAVWPPWRIRWSSDRVLARIPFLSHVVTGNAEPITSLLFCKTNTCPSHSSATLRGS